ncbi:hypothetical protein JX265_003574 [Neoarthrinium moseri]|uniref:Uncharacterized protein n=1 Tax=Neoarthrinium moseri TaxID=1658444 RepID=A0A9Q0AT58_9PEZI|nr:hypothetical protein JX265_003574 [Neoarthrinium moseri]
MPSASPVQAGPNIAYLIISSFLAATLGFWCFWASKPWSFSLINGRKFWEITNARAKKDFMLRARSLIANGLQRYPGRPFRIMADVGEVLILPPKYAYEIRNHDDLSFTKAAFKWFYAHLPGFEGFREGTSESHLMKLVARHQLTHQLMLVTEPVSEECTLALQEIYTDSEEWHEVVAKTANLQLMARVTSRVFLGVGLCRNAQWLRITTTYAVIAFKAVEELRFWPFWLRSTVQWFLPQCTAARALVDEARALINPLLAQRRAEKAEAARRGEKCEYNDAIEWLEQTAQDKQVHYDPACAQLSLSVAALHSTTDFFTQVMLDIASHPKLVTALREEIISVLGPGGWSKQSLYKLKLMDSVLKESQRLKPISIASMRRMTTANVKLSDGTILPKNHLTLVSSHMHWDPESYVEPERFDGYRFYNMRQQPGKENKSQLVSVSPDHMGFGFGLHACPGRFFASEEIKLAMCHILMKYDSKAVAGSDMEPRVLTSEQISAEKTRLLQFSGQSKYPHQPFRLLTDWGEVIILPPEFADEIRNDPRLSFGEAAMQDNHAGIPGFETVRLVGRTDQLIQTVARKHLTKHLSMVIEPLSMETALAVSLNFGESPGWTQVRIKPAILDIIARISSRIYLGEQLCRNEEWLRITKTYTTNFYTASTNLRMFPKSTRFLAHWFLPDCRKLRFELNDARRIIMPLVQRRNQIRQEAAAAGLSIPRFNDAIDWAEQEATATGTSFDPAIFQLTLSLLAIHTTYDLLQQTMIDLAQNPEYIEPIRREVIDALLADGWKKTSLYKMKLLDSAIKETQRMKPGSIVTMRRRVMEDIKLSNGLVLKKGARINVDNRRMDDPAVYKDPQLYNPYRFFEMRLEPGKEHMAQLVSTNSTHLGFGHGEHSCPGRFFAANEIKVALCHILVKYDWRLAPETDVSPDRKGMLVKSSAGTDILIRRRDNLDIKLDML